MIHSLEKLGVRLLGKIVPEAEASAVYCSCEPGTWWCLGEPYPTLGLGNYAYCQYLGTGLGCQINYSWKLGC